MHLITSFPLVKHEWILPLLVAQCILHYPIPQYELTLKSS